MRSITSLAVKSVPIVWALVGIVSIGPASAQEKSIAPKPEGNRWTVPVATSGPTVIPRVFASVRKAYFEGHPDSPVQVQPEIEKWELRYQGEAKSKNIVLEFDTKVLLKDEIKPAEQAGDGTIALHCSQGVTQGEKLRFEPQPHKNTIGYWTKASDTVTWELKLDAANSFNVGILQGCGPKGGGTAKVSLLQAGAVIDAFEFNVEPTGHFQNFVWRNVGILTAKQLGLHSVRIEPVKINEVALMDVRQLHLSPKK